MNKKLLYIAIATAAILTFPLAHAEVIDKIAIIVNNEVVTNGEIDRLLAPIYQQYQTLYSGDVLIKKLEEARKRIMEQLIEDRLILCEAKKLNVEIDEKEVDEKIDETVKHMGSQAKFEETLLEQGITLKSLKMRYREQLMSRRLIDEKVGARVTVTPIEVREYYNKHINEFVQPEEVKLWNILIKPKENARKALELAREISRRLREGGDFAKLAKIYSDGPNAPEGGLMGYVKKGDIMPEVEKVIFNLEPGETSGIIQTNLGYHIFKVEDKKISRTLSLSEAQRDIEEMLFREKAKEKVKGWVETLKKNAYIAFK